MKLALSEHDGVVRELELKIVNGLPIYEFFIEDEESAWEIECNAMTGRVMSITEDSEQDDDEVISEAFTQSAEINEKEAKDIALTAFPGELFGMENKLDSNGSPYYELKIIGDDLHALEVKVDAISGKIIEVEREIYKIGE